MRKGIPYLISYRKILFRKFKTRSKAEEKARSVRKRMRQCKVEGREYLNIGDSSGVFIVECDNIRGSIKTKKQG